MRRRAKAKGTLSVKCCVKTPLTRCINSFIFVEFRNADDANLALMALQNHPFDAKHTFKVNRFTDIERYASLDENYVEPEQEEYLPRVRFSVYHICTSSD